MSRRKSALPPVDADLNQSKRVGLFDDESTHFALDTHATTHVDQPVSIPTQFAPLPDSFEQPVHIPTQFPTQPDSFEQPVSIPTQPPSEAVPFEQPIFMPEPQGDHVPVSIIEDPHGTPGDVSIPTQFQPNPEAFEQPIFMPEPQGDHVPVSIIEDPHGTPGDVSIPTQFFPVPEQFGQEDPHGEGHFYVGPAIDPNAMPVSLIEDPHGTPGDNEIPIFMPEPQPHTAEPLILSNILETGSVDIAGINNFVPGIAVEAHGVDFGHVDFSTSADAVDDAVAMIIAQSH